MTRPRHNLAVVLAAAMLGAVGAGVAALSNMASSPKMPSFGMLYGGSPRSTGNGGLGRGGPSSDRRAAGARRCARARAPKKSARTRANVAARLAANRARQ